MESADLILFVASHFELGLDAEQRNGRVIATRDGQCQKPARHALRSDLKSTEDKSHASERLSFINMSLSGDLRANL
jgi:hypothetical protein